LLSTESRMLETYLPPLPSMKISRISMVSDLRFSVPS
jgi:hypothetical protein